MIAVLSPAKKLNFEKMNRNCESSQPVFKEQALTLATIASNLNANELSKLMGISSNLANLNKKRFDEFSTDSLPNNSIVDIGRSSAIGTLPEVISSILGIFNTCTPKDCIYFKISLFLFAVKDGMAKRT